MVVPSGGRPTGLRDGLCLMEQRSEEGDPFPTLYLLYYYDRQNTPFDVGNVKIGRIGMGDAAVDFPRRVLRGQFEQLGDEYFSLGQDESYYVRLKEKVGEDRLDEVLRALNDIALDPGRFARVQDEPVARRSLLRYITPAAVRTQFHRLAIGGEPLTNYNLAYRYPGDGPGLDFQVIRGSRPPSNVHVLIGSNGVGKSRLLHHIESLVLNPDAPPPDAGSIRLRGVEDDGRIVNVVSVAFSAFEDFDPPEGGGGRISYTYVGLKKPGTEGLKTSADLAAEFAQSMALCQEDARRGRWIRALEELRSDQVFEDEGIADWANRPVNEAREVFRTRLSSGHKAVLLALTRLVECVEEQTLVLIDEPETHLHPPLLAAFTRALSKLLTDRNGVAIVVTHSPVVLQEVPRECVWMLRRFGDEVGVDRPMINTFGENVGTLTREVFGLEVTESGFHKMLTESVDGTRTYRQMIQEFGDQLGSEAKALVQTLISLRRRS